MNLKLRTPKKRAGDDAAQSKAPKFLSDLYRDLADRRLLLPLVALLVAIVAVPMFLSSSSEPVVPPPAAAVDASDTSQLDAAVIVSDPGIRNYRERLDALKAKNPFEAPGGAVGTGGNQGTATTTTSDPSGAGAETGSATASGSSTPTTPATGSTSTPPPSDLPTETGVDTSGGTTPPPADTGGSDGDTTPADVKPETRFYASRVDVTVGPVGKAKTIEGVKLLDFLPDEKTPVVAYLGLVDDNHALFSVNPGVAETDGEGDCAPRGNACMYLSLKVGKEQRFVYGDEADARVYRLKLLDTRIVRVPDPRERDASADGEKTHTHAPVDASSRTN
jgi:hypothetical protein